MSPRPFGRLLPLALAGLAAACDIPSGPPILQQTWVVPGDSLEMNVSQLLPSTVGVASGGGAFVVAVAAPPAFGSTLGALCTQPACQSGGAVNAPVPAFTSPAGVLSRTVTLPAEVTSATVTAGTLNLQVTNNLGFDPLRPNGNTAPFGSIAVAFTTASGTTTTTIGGAAQALPNAAATSLAIPMPAGTYATSFTIALTLTVPAGQNADLAASNGISATAAVSGLTVSQASVVVANEPVSVAPSAYDLDDVDLADQVEGGAFLLDVENPFTASAALNLLIAAPAQAGSPAVNLSKPLAVAASPTSSATVSLTQAELRSLVGKQGVTIAVNGTATGTGAGNTVTVTPAQRLRIRTRIQLILNVGA